jgi:hypothetical protein
MVRTRNVVVLMVLTVLLAGWGGCSWFSQGTASTPIGKTVQAADVQKKLVELAAVEFSKAHLCTNLSNPPATCQNLPKVPEAAAVKAKEAYQKWAVSQTALAAAISMWKSVESTENAQRLQTAFALTSADVRTYLSVVAAFVDVPALEKKAGG